MFVHLFNQQLFPSIFIKQLLYLGYYTQKEEISVFVLKATSGRKQE